jgi:integrase
MGRAMQPIRDLNQLEEFKLLLAEKDLRNWMLFVLGINIGLRVSDLLPLRVKDVSGEYLHVVEKKSKKRRRILLNEDLQVDIRRYLDYYDWLKPNDLLFESNSYRTAGEPISSVQAYRIMRDAGDVLGLDSIGTHTMRKTFGYHFYQRTKDIATLQLLMNHSSPRVTMKYIGILQDEMDFAMRGFKL